MQIFVHTDSAIHGGAALTSRVEATVEAVLGHFGAQLMSVHVHLRDANSHKQGKTDKECTMEGRLAGLQPIAVSQAAATVGEAIEGAVEKLHSTLQRNLERLGEHKGKLPAGGERRS